MIAEDRKKLTVGIAVALAVGWLAFRTLHHEQVAADAGPTYATPIGVGSVGQIVVSLLISLGGFVLTAGVGVVKSLFAKLFPSVGGSPAPAATGPVDPVTAAEIVVLDALRSAGESAASTVVGGDGIATLAKGPARGELLNAVQSYEDAVARHRPAKP